MSDLTDGMKKWLEAQQAYTDFVEAKRGGNPEKVRKAQERAYHTHLRFIAVGLKEEEDKPGD